MAAMMEASNPDLSRLLEKTEAETVAVFDAIGKFNTALHAQGEPDDLAEDVLFGTLISIMAALIGDYPPERHHKMTARFVAALMHHMKLENPMDEIQKP